MLADLLARLAALESEVVRLTDELAEFKAATYDLAVECGKENPGVWIGGNDGPDD